MPAVAITDHANLFLAYLRGIETDEEGRRCEREVVFLAYLRGIETRQKRRGFSVYFSFLAYLRGIETRKAKSMKSGSHSF